MSGLTPQLEGKHYLWLQWNLGIKTAHGQGEK